VASTKAQRDAAKSQLRATLEYFERRVADAPPRPPKPVGADMIREVASEIRLRLQRAFRAMSSGSIDDLQREPIGIVSLQEQVLRLAYGHCKTAIDATLIGDMEHGVSELLLAEYWAGMLRGISSGKKELRSEIGRRLNKDRHAENYSLRADVEAWYGLHRHEYGPATHAAPVAAKVVPMKHDTILEWIRELDRKHQPKK
jgi:hypothetical protein